MIQRVRRIAFVTMLLLAGGSVVSSSGARSACTADDPAVKAVEPTAVDFELLESLHMAVQVKLNDAGPFRMIFDLGSPVMLISGKAAAEAGLISAERAKKPAFFGMRGQGTVKKFEMGELTADNMPVMIMDHPTLKAAAEILGPIDGIVGYPLFARYRFTIDYPASRMTFTPTDYKPRDVMQLMMGRMFARPKKSLIAPAGLWGMEVEKPTRDDAAGVVVARVWPASPAELAGLQPGDRLLTIDGRWTDSVQDVADAASFVQPGEAAGVLLRRGEEQLELVLRPALGL